VVRYSFIVVDLHHLLSAGLPAHSKMTRHVIFHFEWLHCERFNRL
jgi:hypothetical protein